MQFKHLKGYFLILMNLLFPFKDVKDIGHISRDFSSDPETNGIRKTRYFLSAFCTSY